MVSLRRGMLSIFWMGMGFEGDFTNKLKNEVIIMGYKYVQVR